MAPPKVLTDTSLWLHNKLGTSNDLWSGGSICSQLNQEVLKSIRDCFNLLQSQVKIKLLLSFLHIPRRNIDEWKGDLDEILDIALEDSDQWVSMVAELLKKYPSDGTINFEIVQNSGVFTDLVNELKKIVRKHADKHILPLECLYLNKNALSAQVGHISQPAKHFSLKQKPKSAILRAELLDKSNDAASSTKTKISSSNVPIRCRGITNDSRPMTSIPSAPFKKPSALITPGRGTKKQGGIQLLDITQQPLGRDAKRKKLKEDKEKEEKEKEAEALATPDYAAGLTSMIPPSPAPNYAPATPMSNHDSNLPPSSVQTKKAQPKAETPQPPPPPLQQPQIPIPQPVVPSNQYDPNLPPAPQLQPQGQTQAPVPAPSNPPAQYNQPSQGQQFIVGADRRTVNVTPELRAAVAEVFRGANRATKPEKALIVGFICGSKENPCPQLGNIVTIKLGDHIEKVTYPDGSETYSFVETHYQMNYETGEGKKLKRPRPLTAQEIQQLHIQQQQQSNQMMQQNQQAVG